MAIILAAASSQYGQRTTDVLSANSDWTLCAWLRLATLSMWHGIYQAGISTSNENSSDNFEVRNVGNVLLIEGTNATGTKSIGAGTTALSANTWYHVAGRRSGSSLTAYLNGTLEATATMAVTGRETTNAMLLGAWDPTNPTDFADYRMAGLKMWARALSDAEIAAEVDAIWPVSYASLYGFWPMPSGSRRNADFSGAARDWTMSGSPTDGDPPPVIANPRSVLSPLSSAVVVADAFLPAFARGREPRTPLRQM